jgi:NAD(P)-dependent dehydrogenase (short-subunit alcohol dehydrogenase family)
MQIIEGHSGQQLALITGGAVRIGKTIANCLANAGYAVAIQYNRSKDDAVELVAAITRMGGKAACFGASLEKHAEVEALIEQVCATMGPLTCLVNNASHFADDRLPALTAQSWREHMAVNLEAPVFLSQAFAAQLPDGENGNIVNIIDQRVLRPNPHFFSYTLSKSALWAATRTMAQALAPRIRVNAIGPGPALCSVYQSKADFERECRAMPLGQGTTPEEIADAVLFVLRAPSMTGQMIALDGGQHLLWQTPDVRVK